MRFARKSRKPDSRTWPDIYVFAGLVRVGIFRVRRSDKKPLPLGRFLSGSGVEPVSGPANARRKDQPDMVFKKYPRWSRPNTEGACHGHCRSSARHRKYLCRDHDSPIVWQPEGARHRWYFATICDAGGQPMIEQVVALDEKLLVSLASQQPPRMAHLFEDELAPRSAAPRNLLASAEEFGARLQAVPSPLALPLVTFLFAKAQMPAKAALLQFIAAKIHQRADE
jgi:hypothetical protein